MIMELNRKLRKLLFQFPATCVYGNEGDFSRYRMLKEITNIFVGKDFFVNKYLRDKVNIIVYPMMYANDILAINDDKIHTLDTVDRLKEKACDWLLIPGNEAGIDGIYIFPVTEVSEDFSNICEAIFVESFPFGKKEFCDYVLEFIKKQGITCHKSIILYDEGRKYGATDISDESVGIENINKKMSCYVDSICTLSDLKMGYKDVDIKKSYVEKKRVMLSEAMKIFLEGYDQEFKYLKYRWFGNEDNKGVLTGSAFEYISDYKNVKGSDNVEKKMFDNLINLISEKKKDICNMINALLNTYLIDFVMISEEEIEQYYKNLIKEIKKTYRFDSKEKCPNNKIDYRALCESKKYVIKLRTYFEKMIDEKLKSMISSQIKRTLEKCEEEYYETIKI